MIYYFSATGNSRHVANRLAESLGETVTSVMDVLHQEITVDDTCIGCGLCAKNCPVNAIKMKDGKLFRTKQLDRSG